MSAFPTLFISHGAPIQVSLGQSSIIMLSKPIALLQGTQVGKSRFAPGNTAKGGNVQPVGGPVPVPPRYQLPQGL